MHRRRFCAITTATLASGLVGCSHGEGTDTPTSTAEPQTKPPTETPGEATPDNVQQVGEQFTGPLDAIGWKATNPRTAESIDGTTPAGSFVLVYLNADELVGETVTITSDVIRLEDANGNRYAVDDPGMNAVDNPFEFGDVYPGTGTEGNLVFDVPADASGLRLRVGQDNIHYVDLNLDDT